MCRVALATKCCRSFRSKGRMIVSLKTRIIAGAAIAAGLAAGQAQATLYTVTTTGIIASGTDSTGVFGTIGDLSGAAFTLSVTFDSGHNTFFDNSPIYQKLYNFTGGDPAAAIITATVNGHSFSLQAGNYSSDFYVNDYFHQYGSGVDELYAYADGTASDGQYGAAFNFANSSVNDFAPGPQLDQALSYTVGPSDNWSATFDTNGSDGIASFSGAPGNIELTVPEPATLALFGVGLLGLGIARRRNAA